MEMIRGVLCVTVLASHVRTVHEQCVDEVRKRSRDAVSGGIAASAGMSRFSFHSIFRLA